MADITVDVSALAGTGTLGDSDAQPHWIYRDADVLDEIERILDLTGEFDGVHRCALSEFNQPSDHLRAAVIEPATETEADLWDSYSDGPMELVKAQCAITLIVRHPDPKQRDRLVDRLKSIARNALNGQSLCGLTQPDFTRFQSFQSIKPKPPERQVRGTFGYRYTIDAFDEFSANE